MKVGLSFTPRINPTLGDLWLKAVETCDGDAEKLLASVKEVVHHCSGEHEWTEDGEHKSCSHAPYSVEEQADARFLTPGSKAHEGKLASFPPYSRT